MNNSDKELKQWLEEAIQILQKEIDMRKAQIYAYRKLQNASGFINEDVTYE